MSLQALPYILTLGFFYGTGLIADRFSIGQFAPTTYLFLRLGISSLGFIIIFVFKLNGRSWPRGAEIWKKGAVLGVLGSAAPMILIMTSLKYQSSGVTSILITLNPAITLIMAHIFLEDERFNLWMVFGIGTAFVGALLLVMLGESGLADLAEFNPVGYVLVILAMICAAAMTIYVRKSMRGLDSFQVGAVRIMVAALVFLPLSLLGDGIDLSRVDRQGLFALGWATLAGTFLGISLEFYNVKRFGARVSSMTTYVMMLTATLGGWLILKEVITPGILAGMALVVTGIVLTNRANGKQTSGKSGQ